MVYVINLEDGGGQEFYLTVGGAFIGLGANAPQEPQAFTSYKLTAKKIDQLSQKYPATCRIYALERGEFDGRRAAVQQSKAIPGPGEAVQVFGVPE